MTEALHSDRGPRIQLLIAGALATMAGLGMLDFLLDEPDSRTALHALVEILFVGVCLASAAFFGWSWRRSERSLTRVRAALAVRQEERDAWRGRAESILRGLSEAIDSQLTAWGLTPAEREVAFLLLKGYSHRDAAALCGRSERTVRQHAVSVYAKSGLAGRAELSAFFLEDMLAPPPGAGETPR